jgi:hypothetical protein
MHSPEEEDSIEIVKVPVGSGMFYAINQDELVATTQEKTILTYKRTDHFKEMIKMMCENEKNSSSNEQITQTETVQYYDDNKFMKNCDKIIKKSTIVN